MRTALPRTNLFAYTILLFVIALVIPFLGSAQNSPAPDDEKAVRQRVDALLKKMTLEEKIGQLSQLFDFPESKAMIDDAVVKYGIGSVLFVTDPTEINRLQHLAVEKTRLHIPLIFGFDVIHGLRTIFPVPIAMAASWDPAGSTKTQSIAAQEARSVGIDWTFAPMVDIARDPRWGRIVEGAGEDPFLGSAMAAAQVRGFQGEFIGAPDHVLACVKHFAGYGAAEGGRDYDASYIPRVTNVQRLSAPVPCGCGCRCRFGDERVYGFERCARDRESHAVARRASRAMAFQRLRGERREHYRKASKPIITRRIFRTPHCWPSMPASTWKWQPNSTPIRKAWSL